MKVSTRHALGVPTSAALELLADSDFLEWRCAQNVGMAERLLTHRVNGDELTIETTASVPMTWLPSRVVGHLPEPPRIDRHEVWSLTGGRGRTWFEISLVPTTVSGVMRLQATGQQSCDLVYDFEMKVSLPLVGGLVERSVSSNMTKSLTEEATTYARFRASGSR